VTFDAGRLTFVPEWQRQVASDGIRARPLVVDDMLLVGSQDQRVYALNRASGASIWFQDTGAQVLSDLVLLQDNVVIVGTLSSARMLVAYDAADAGRELWQYPSAAAAGG
ncbi:MAG: PQQ-binding-like beta-propeller repeat protein, partial [Anaerolineae bacterium]|nr:PQQ-binding-like beta-propeller repeat protein [Anaerolineae bacterium]